MNVWTSGGTTVVVGPSGLSVHQADRNERLLSGDALGLPKPEKQDESQHYKRSVLAVAPNGEHAWLADGEGQLLRITLCGDNAPEPLGWRVLDAACVDANNLVAAIVKKKTTLVRGSGRSSWSLTIDRPGSAPKAQFPAVVWDPADARPYSRTRGFSLNAGRLRLSHNEHGTAFADSDSGIVGVLRPGKKSLEAVMRVPTQAEAVLEAAATEDGLLVGVCLEGRDSALVRFDHQGKCQAQRELTGLGPFALHDNTVIALSVSDAVLLELKLETLEDAQPEVPVAVNANGDVTLSYDGESFACGLGDTAAIAQRDGDGWELTPLSEPSNKPRAHKRKAKALAPKGPMRLKGEPQLAPDPTRPMKAWRFRTHTDVEIVVPVVSTGGPGKGMYVELSGPAVDGKLFELASVEVEGVGVPLQQADLSGDRVLRAELSDLQIPAGGVLDETIKKMSKRLATAPKDTFVAVTVRGKASKAGNGLLLVRVGFPVRGTRGSVMCGRTVLIGDDLVEQPDEPDPSADQQTSRFPQRGYRRRSY